MTPRKSPAVPLEAPEKPEQAPMRVSGHPLEDAPLNSKVVVTADGAILSPTNGDLELLDKKDPASRLPVGAKIVKAQTADGDTVYLAMELNCLVAEEPSVHDSALDAILKYPDLHYHR